MTAAGGPSGAGDAVPHGSGARPGRLVCELLAAAAAAAPRRRAVVVVGGASVTYAQLAERTDRLASWLVAGGVRRGDRIAVRAANGLAHFDAYLAAARVGAACVPVPAGMAPPAVARIVADVQPALAFADAAGAEALRAAGVDVVVEGSRRYRAALAIPPVPPAAVPMPEPSDVALIIYTSGTGGRPRGVCLSQAAITCNAAMTTAAQRFGSQEVYLTSTPLYHTSAAARVFTMLDGAHTHVVLRRFDPAGWLEAVETERVTSAIAVPTQIQRILDHDGYHPARSASLRLLVYGTAPSAPSQVLRMREQFPCGLYQGYGLTETCGVVTGFTAADHRALAGPDDPRLGSCGRPMDGNEVVVRRPDGTAVVPGEVGEITVRSPKVMSGYWGDAAATAAAFADGWLLTGDLATVDAGGYVTIVGRSKEVVVSGGVNIYPAQVERVIAAHPDVEEVAVFGAPDAGWGEVPAAAVRMRPGGTLAAADIGALVVEHLDRHSRPRHVLFVEDFPRTATGKIRKQDLPRLLE